MTEALNSAQRQRGLKNDPAISNASKPSSSTPIAGNTVKLVAVDPGCHAAILYNLTHDCEGSDTLWDYMGYGPFSDIDEMAGWMATCSTAGSAVFYTMIDCSTGQPFGMASYLNIHQAVLKRASWIKTHVAEAKRQNEHVLPRQYVSGESYFYLGKRYQLK